MTDRAPLPAPFKLIRKFVSGFFNRKSEEDPPAETLATMCLKPSMAPSVNTVGAVSFSGNMYAPTM